MTGLLKVPEPKKLAWSHDLIHLHPVLAGKWEQIYMMYLEATGNELSITCTWRSQPYQEELYKQGRTRPGPIVTWTTHSRHTRYPARAIDVVVDNSAVQIKVDVTWDVHLYAPLVDICQQLGLESGGMWKENKDWPHIQLPDSID